MRTARVPDDSLPPLTRSVAACLAAILELETDEVPAPAADHPEPWTAWRVWLATPRARARPGRAPREFAWPGPWLALLRGGIAAVAYGSPPGGLAWAPLGGSFEDIEGGYAIAPHHVALWAPPDAADARTDGRVEAIAIAPAAEAPMALVEQATARAGRGLEGDRYVGGEGTFSNPYSRGHDLTLIEARGRRRPRRRARGPAPQRRHPRHRPQRARRPPLPRRRGRVRGPAPVRALRAPPAVTTGPRALVHGAGCARTSSRAA